MIREKGVAGRLGHETEALDWNWDVWAI